MYGFANLFLFKIGFRFPYVCSRVLFKYDQSWFSLFDEKCEWWINICFLTQITIFFNVGKRPSAYLFCYFHFLWSLSNPKMRSVHTIHHLLMISPMNLEPCLQARKSICWSLIQKQANWPLSYLASPWSFLLFCLKSKTRV